MKTPIKAVALSTLFASSLALTATPVLAPNGDFEIPGGASWGEAGGDNTTFSYPTSGGNGGGYGVMDNNGTPFGVFISNDDITIPIASLGLEVGETYDFFQDLIILSGNEIGGMKIEFYDTGGGLAEPPQEVYVQPVGDGSTWETYVYPTPVPTNAVTMKFVPLWGPGSSVGYDNIGVEVPAEAPFQADIATTTVLTWFPEGTDHQYQPQRSDDNLQWEDFGPVFAGETVTSTVDSEQAPFYRVLEFEGSNATAFLNGSFEVDGGGDPPCAESWSCLGSQPASRSTDDARTGEASMSIAVQNDDGGAPNNSEIQQNIADVGGMPITAGESYDFSFWAKQVSSGVSYVQQHRLLWIDDSGATVSEAFGFTAFSGGSNSWAEVSVPDLVAPDGATNAFLQIFGATGAVPGESANGEVLIDDITLGGTSFVLIEELEATTAEGLQVSWPTDAGKTYQVQNSTDGEEFDDFGGPMTGDGSTGSISDTFDPEVQLYRVIETP